MEYKQYWARECLKRICPYDDKDLVKELGWICAIGNHGKCLVWIDSLDTKYGLSMRYNTSMQILDMF